MDTIDISNKIDDFKQVFESESRIIFSAKFGDGKSYFLKKFMESYPKEKNDYYFITLHPVNYVVEENKDVIEYIKRDILFQLIKDGKIYDYKEDKIFNAVCNRESFSRLVDFLACIAPIDGLKDGIDNVKKLLETVKDKYDKQNDIKMADDYLNGFYGLKGSISECDAFTCLIQKTLEHHQAKSVLIIEDLDRIDPAHLFRIMNVLSSQVDNPYYSDVPNGNKFGFDKIILVMDYDITKHIFHHFYGKEANYEGYMNKFLNTIPFHYSIKEEAHRQVRKKILDICKSEEVLSLDQNITKDRVSVPLAIYNLSVRRSKEFLDIDIYALFRKKWLNGEYTIPTDTVWVRILVCLRFLMPDITVSTILEAMIFGFTDIKLAEFAIPFFFAKSGENFFYIDINVKTYLIRYDIILKKVTKEECRRIPNEKKIRMADIKKLLHDVQNSVCDLLIG